jgi:hypothetical protein
MLCEVPAIVGMTFELHASIGGRLPLDRTKVDFFARSLVLRKDALALLAVEDDAPIGMLCASIERSPLSSVAIAVEHGWYCRRTGARTGHTLLSRYIEWARERGAWCARLSTPAVDPVRSGLARMGFVSQETAWVMVL